MNEILSIQDQILSYRSIDGQNEEGLTTGTPPPYMEVGVISGHGGYYPNYYEYQNNYHGYDYGQGDYQRPDYDTQQHIKGNFMLVVYICGLKCLRKCVGGSARSSLQVQTWTK